MATVAWSLTDHQFVNHSPDALTITGYQNGAQACRANLNSPKFGGRWYFEVALQTVYNNDPSTVYVGMSHYGYSTDGSDERSWLFQGSGFKRNNGISSAWGSALATGDRVQVAYTMNALWVGKNGVWFQEGNPATGANPMFSGLFLHGYKPTVRLYYTTALVGYFARSAFLYTPPDGFLSLEDEAFRAPRYVVDMPVISADTQADIGGSILVQVTEDQVPGAYEVCLHRRADHMPVRVAQSGASGGCEFARLKDQEYYVVCFDHTNPLRTAAVQDRVRPS